MRAARAMDAIKSINRDLPQVLLGAGTVMSARAAKDCIEEGVSFVASPCLDEGVVRHCIHAEGHRADWTSSARYRGSKESRTVKRRANSGLEQSAKRTQLSQLLCDEIQFRFLQSSLGGYAAFSIPTTKFIEILDHLV